MDITLANAFSLNMVTPGQAHILHTYPISLAQAADWIGKNILITNAIGHADTDNLVRALLASEGAIVPPGTRSTVTINAGNGLLVAQYRGPRLPEGATVLPEGAAIDWVMVLLLN
jgi:hypothetical protein